MVSGGAELSVEPVLKLWAHDMLCGYKTNTGSFPQNTQDKPMCDTFSAQRQKKNALKLSLNLTQFQSRIEIIYLANFDFFAKEARP